MSYQSASKALVAARREGLIPWRRIEDRLHKPRRVLMSSGLPDFAETAARAYRRNVWDSQPVYLKTWLEKDALSGIFEDGLDRYGVTLNVGRGFDGWDSIHNAASRLGDEDVILYFGDFDPSGEDMVRSLREAMDSWARSEATAGAMVNEGAAGGQGSATISRSAQRPSDALIVMSLYGLINVYGLQSADR